MKKLASIILFFLCFSALYIIDQWQLAHWRSEKIIELDAALHLYQTRLKSTISRRFNAIESFASLFVLHPKTTPIEFSHFAAFLLQFNPPIRAIQYADSDTRVIYVYPPEGNEITIKKPMTLLADPKRASFVKKTIREKRSILQGPFELRQGGSGVVVRFPIFKGNDFIGLSIGVYDISVLANEALEGLNFNQFAFNLKDPQGNIFWSSGNISDNSLNRELSVAGSTWTIVANWLKPSTPPMFSRALIWFFGLGFFLAVFFSLQIAWKQEQRLKKEVEERTRELSNSNNSLLIEIAERKLAEKASQASEEKFSKAFQNAPLLMSISSLKDGCYLDVNEAFVRVTGYQRNIAIGSTFTELGFIKKEDREQFAKELNAKGRVNDMELVLNSANGDLINCLYSGELIEVDGKKRLLSIAMDITERKQLESKLQQAQKMESIGNLAGGIAHDFNNLLFPILGMSEMLLEDLPPHSPEHENVQEIFNAGRRAGELVKQILAFSRQSEHTMTPVRVQNILKEVLKLIRSTIPSDIEISQDIHADCGLVKADAVQIHQVAMNLITNAYHAVEEKSGKIIVQLKQIIIGPDKLSDNSLEQGQYVVLTVSDTGIGIGPDIIGKIFEPYYTTKEQGKGTGLGLAVVYGIVKEHQGNITVHSEVGKGTTFNVYLPLMIKTEDIISIRELSKSEMGTENILLVDDEEPVARLEKLMLLRLGYKVTEHTESSNALNEFNMNPEKFDLVISDMTMPNMTGDQLAKKLKEIRPDIPIIICTGFSERINKEKAEAFGINGFLMKPVNKFQMANMVRKVLDEGKFS